MNKQRPTHTIPYIKMAFAFAIEYVKTALNIAFTSIISMANRNKMLHIFEMHVDGCLCDFSSANL